MLISTELMARGMDFKGVSCVINYDFPQSAVSYVHRIGRTARAGVWRRLLRRCLRLCLCRCHCGYTCGTVSVVRQFL